MPNPDMRGVLKKLPEGGRCATHSPPFFRVCAGRLVTGAGRSRKRRDRLGSNRAAGARGRPAPRQCRGPPRAGSTCRLRRGHGHRGHPRTLHGADICAARDGYAGSRGHRSVANCAARIDASQAASLDTSYSSYIAGIADRRSKEDGIQVGAAAAAALLTLRKHDGYDDVVEYQCKSNLPGIGEFEPIKSCGTQPVGCGDPYTFVDPGRFGPAGPQEIVSAACAGWER